MHGVKKVYNVQFGNSNVSKSTCKLTIPSPEARVKTATSGADGLLGYLWDCRASETVPNPDQDPDELLVSINTDSVSVLSASLDLQYGLFVHRYYRIVTWSVAKFTEWKKLMRHGTEMRLHGPRSYVHSRDCVQLADSIYAWQHDTARNESLHWCYLLCMLFT